MNSDEAFALRMLKNGAFAYINKQTNAKQIVEIIRTVLSGKKYFSAHQSEMLADQAINPSTNSNDLHLLLSDREYQVFNLLASGTRNSEIAEKLSISKNTVNNHRNSIMKKMNMSQNSELTKYAIQHKIIL
jgi:DNA-binding NarL/FixJ family response regulator